MNFLQRIVNAFRRDNSGYYANLHYNTFHYPYGRGADSVLVNNDIGTRVTSVFSAVNGISQDLAKLPINIFKDDEDGNSEIRRNTDAHRLVRIQPNEMMGSFNFWYSMLFAALSKGNGTAYILRRDSRPVELLPFVCEEVYTEGGEVFYKMGQKIFPAKDVFHIKMYSFDGIKGVSPIMFNAEKVGYRIKLQEYSAKALGSIGTGFISSPVKQEEGEKIAKGLKASIANGEIPFIGGAETKWNRQIISPEEGQFLETAKITDRQLYGGIYRYPASFFGDNEHSTYSNNEQHDIFYAKYTLTPWARVIEDEIDRKLMTEQNKTATRPFYSKFDFKEIYRGDLKSRTEYIQVMKERMTINELRKVEGLPPIEGGDVILIQGANVPLNQLNSNNND